MAGDGRGNCDGIGDLLILKVERGLVGLLKLRHNGIDRLGAAVERGPLEPCAPGKLARVWGRMF